MSSATTYALIETLISDNWDHCPIRNFDSDIPVPADKSAYAELSYPLIAQENQKSTGSPGSNYFRVSHEFLFSVYVPTVDDKLTWLGRLDTLRAALRNYRGDSGNFRIFDAPPAAPHEGISKPGYFELSIGVPYEHDFLG